MVEVLPVPELAQQAMVALQKGDKERARELLVSVIQEHPNDERLWLWLSWTLETEEERQKCLAKLHTINPDNPAARRLFTKATESSSGLSLGDGLSLPSGYAMSPTTQGQNKPAALPALPAPPQEPASQNSPTADMEAPSAMPETTVQDILSSYEAPKTKDTVGSVDDILTGYKSPQQPPGQTSTPAQPTEEHQNGQKQQDAGHDSSTSDTAKPETPPPAPAEAASPPATPAPAESSASSPATSGEATLAPAEATSPPATPAPAESSASSPATSGEATPAPQPPASPSNGHSSSNGNGHSSSNGNGQSNGHSNGKASETPEPTAPPAPPEPADKDASAETIEPQPIELPPISYILNGNGFVAVASVVIELPTLEYILNGNGYVSHAPPVEPSPDSPPPLPLPPDTPAPQPTTPANALPSVEQVVQRTPTTGQPVAQPTMPPAPMVHPRPPMPMQTTIPKEDEVFSFEITLPDFDELHKSPYVKIAIVIVVVICFLVFLGSVWVLATYYPM